MADDPSFPDDATRRARLEAVLVEVLEAEEAGAATPAAAWTARYPEFRADLEEFFADQAAMLRTRSAVGFGPVPELTGYQVVRELGRGAMGVVYEARQLDPARVVAVKVLPTARLRTPLERVRFRREARAAARLDHPGVIPIYEIGEAQGVPFYTMRLAPGGPLSAALDRYRADPAAAARLVAALARAVHHAHLRGLLHRDLKPSNILLDGEGRGYVADFGLVRDLADPDPLTRTGDVVGTPPYMAPEQTEAKGGPCTVATDVYGLGAILYACLTGRSPFTGPTPAAVLLKVRESEPDSPARLNSWVPRDLDAIVLKCLEKDPAERYPSADALADDLDRFLRGDPVRAKPVGPARRAARWVARHPLSAALAALTSLAVLGAFTLVVRTHYREAAAAEREARDLLQLRMARETAERERFFTLLERARQRRADPYPGWSPDSLADLRELARMAPTADALPDLRSEAAAALAAVELIPAGAVAPGVETYAVDYSPDGRWLATGDWKASADGTIRVRVYDPATGRESSDLTIPSDSWSRRWVAREDRPDGVRSLRFSPDGRWLVAGTRTGRVARWDLRKVHPEALAWPAHTEEPRVRDTAVYGLGFTADGSEILSSAHATVRSWHPDGRPGRISIDQYRLPCQFPPVQDRVPVYVPEWRRHWILSLPDREVRHTGDGVRGRWPLAVAPGGRLIAFMPDNAGGPGLQAVDDPDARPRLLAAPSGAPVEMPGVTFLGFDPTGTLLVSVEEVAGRVRLWDVATGLLAAERLTAADATRAAFSPDGRRLAVCGGHGVALFDIPSRTMDTVAPVAEPAVVSVAANPDHTVLTVTGDGSVCPRLYRWQLDRFGPADEQGLKAGRALPAADASPDGRVFVYGLERGGADYLAATDGRNWGIRDMKDARFGPDGRLWTLEADRLRLALPPPSDGEVVWENDPPAAEAGRVLRVVAAGRHRVLVGRRDGWLFRIDLGTGAARAWPLLSSSVAGVAISPDGQTALVGGDGGELRLLDLESGTVAQVRDAHRGAVPAVVFGRQLLVSGSADRRVRLWTPTGDPIATLRMAGPVRKVLLSAEESSLLILVEGERAVRRWRLDSLFREWATLGIDSGVVRQTPPG